MKYSGIVILRAPPGCGKTSVSFALQTRWKPAFRASVDTVRYFMQPRERTSNQLWTAKLGILDCSLNYARQGIPSIIESVFQDVSIVDALMWKAKAAGVDCKVFTLSAKLETLLERNSARDSYYVQSDTRIRELYESYDWSHGQRITTDGKIVEEVAEEIEEACFSQPGPQPVAFRHLIFARHGDADRSATVYKSELDIGLTARGKAQCAITARALAPVGIQRIISSPLRRALESAAIFSSVLGCDVSVDARLREREFPELYGMTRIEIASTFGPDFAANLARNPDNLSTPTSESLQEARERVLNATSGAVRQNERTLLLSHGGPHSWLCSALLGMPLEHHRSISLDAGAYSMFRYDRNGSFVKLLALNSRDFVPSDL